MRKQFETEKKENKKEITERDKEIKQLQKAKAEAEGRTCTFMKSKLTLHRCVEFMKDSASSVGREKKLKAEVEKLKQG
eukprot:4466827-Amphidinium_carterae.1